MNQNTINKHDSNENNDFCDENYTKFDNVETNSEYDDTDDYCDFCKNHYSDCECEIIPGRCDWCNRPGKSCGQVYEYKNENYSGNFCECCIWFADSASEVVERDNT